MPRAPTARDGEEYEGGRMIRLIKFRRVLDGRVSNFWVVAVGVLQGKKIPSENKHRVANSVLIILFLH